MIKFATVLDVNPDSLFVRDNSGQEILVYAQNAQQFAPGDYVRIIYNGAMTLSLPPQISAIFVTLVRRGARICGEILAVGQGNFTLADIEGGEIQVNYPDASAFSPGDSVCVQYDGRMTLSIPPQIQGISVERSEASRSICGEIQSIGSGYFLLLSDDAMEIRINYENASSELLPGQNVCVQYSGAMTRSIPPQISAISITPRPSEAQLCGEILVVEKERFLLLDDTQQAEIIVNTPSAREYSPGDMVCVVYSGAMTRSLPPQISAQRIMRR